MATNSVVSDDIRIYNKVQESWMKQMFLVYQAALDGNLREIKDGRSIRKAYRAMRHASENIELKEEMYHEMQVRHLISTDIQREDADIMLALDPQMFSHEPFTFCIECKKSQSFLDKYATQSGLVICVECINEVVKLLIEESVAQGHTQLVKNQFRTHFLIDWIYEPNFFQLDAFMWDVFSLDWLNVVKDVFQKTFLEKELNFKRIHSLASGYLGQFSYFIESVNEEPEK